MLTKTTNFKFGSFRSPEKHDSGLMKERSFTSGAYLFGFNGMEKDEEVSGDGNYLDYGARARDPRLGGGWWSVDPLASKYPELGPYNFCANNPIMFVDVDGKDIIIYFKDQDGKPATIKYTADMVANTGNTFADDAITTLNTLRNGSETAKGIIDKANSTTRMVKLKYTNIDGERSYDTKTGTILWSPAIGDIYPIADPVTGEKVQAPGLTLSHELNHFINHLDLLDKVEKARSEFGEGSSELKDAEKNLKTFEFTPHVDENSIVVPNESKVAKDFKMGTRENYDTIGKKIVTTGPMSTKKDDKKAYQKKLNNENKKGAGKAA